MQIMWINMTGGRSPCGEHMMGLDQGRVDWLYEQLTQMIEWDRWLDYSRVLPLHAAIVTVLFALWRDLSPTCNRRAVRL